MNSRSLVYAGVLLLGLVITAVILNRSVVQGVVNSGDVDLSIGSSTYILGQPIDFNGIVDFADQEEATIHQVQLNVSGPQGMTVLLPVAAGTFDLSNQPGVTGSLIVTVTFTNVSAISVGTLPSGTLPGGTLPGTTIPGSGQFKGDAAGARITYLVTWTPTVFLDPAPVFTLVPQTETLFSIPTLTPPATTTGTVLPNTDLEFTIPVVGAPTGAALPAVGSTFTIPTVSISTNATTTVPDLPDTKFQTTTPSGATGGFNIPSYAVASAPSGVQSFPDSTFAFAIPTTTLATPPTGVPVLPELAEHFTITGSSTPRGLGSDGTDFWVISDNTGSGGVDEILRFTSSGVATGTAIVAPSSDLEGIAFLNDSLWVVENRFRCFDLIDSTRCDREHRIFKIGPDSPPAGSTEADWASLTTLNATDTFEQIGGITAEGGGPTGSLWLATKGGFKFYNISQTGSEVNSPFTDSFVAGMDGLAVSGDFLYTSKGSTITQWTKTGEQVQQFAAVVDGTTTPIGGIRGMTFKPVSSKQVLFVGSSDGKVYKGFFVESVTTDPVGITISPSTASVGRALWIVVDGNPKDKILKVDADTGSVITTFGTSGAADAPSKNIQGVTFLGGFLWLVANEDFERYLYKVNPANGALVSSFILGNTADIFDDLGGITNDGTNLIVHTRSFFNTVYVLDTTGQRTGASEAFPCCPSYNGARGLAYNSGRGQFFAGRDGTVGIYDSSLSFIREQMVTQSSSPISGIKGLAFDGDLLYIAHGSTGTITKSFLATTVTTKPKGIAFTSASTTPGKALWILVDGDPKDKLLKVDPDTGDLNTSFGTSGAVDAPSDRTEGITFLDTGDPTTSFLWIIANEGSAPKLYKINATTGALVTTFNLESTANIFDDLGGITNDGTNLIVHTRTFNDVIVLDPANGFKVERSFPCCANSGVFGATALTRHAGRGQFFAAKNDKLLTMDSARQLIEREQTVTLDGGSITGNIEGLAFDQDVLYVAQIDGSTGKVSIGALRVTATISPRGLAFSPEGSSLIGSPIGKALWVLVDGDPKDKILKIDPATNQLITAFGTSGAVDAPSSRTEGMTFLDGFLWIIANDNFERKLYKVRATNGTIAATFNLSGFPNGFIFDDMGGITNDGTNLLITVLPFNDVVIVDTSGQLVERKFTCCPITQGSRGAAYRTSKSQLFMAKGGTVMQADASGFEVQVVREFNTSLTGIQGLTFNGETLYVAHDGTGEISTTAVPSDVTNRPRGLTYDPNANELYILVDGAGKAKDHIVVVRPTATSTVNVLRDFPAPDNDTDGITFLGGSLYVAVRDQDNCCPPPTIVELNSQTGATINTLDVGQVLFDKITGLNNDGTSLIALPEFGGGQAIYIDPSDGSEVDRVFFFDPDDPGFFEERYDGLAFLTTTKNFFPVKDSTVFQFDEEGQKHAEFTIVTSGVDDIAGSVFVGQVLYVAEANGSTIRSARIPQAATVITNNPRGMATDGQTLFILVDATPKDKIMKLATTSTPITLDTSFGSAGAVDAPGKEAEGLAFHNGSLWVVTNEVRTFEIDGPFGPTFIKGVFPGFHRLDAMTGAELERFPISVIPQSFEELPILTDPIGSLASDGQFLYLGTKGDIGIEGVWYVFDPADPFAPVQRIDEISGSLPFLEGFEAMDMTIGAVFPANRELLATGRAGGAQADKLARLNKDTGEMFQQFDLTGSGPKDIMGLAYINRTLFLADNVSNTILGTALPENTVELTIAGSYTGQLTVDASPDTVDTVAVSSAVRAFSIGRNSQVAVQLTSPVDGFVVTTATTTISGRLSDPSILTTTVGIQLPFVEIVSDDVDPVDSLAVWDIGVITGGSAGWHVACTGDASFLADKAVSVPCAWRYSRPGAGNFDLGSRTAGTLTTQSPFGVSSNTDLSFQIWYDTQADPDNDLKLIEIAVVTKDAADNDIVGPFQALRQIVGPGFGGNPPPAGSHPSFAFIQVEQSRFRLESGSPVADFVPIQIPLAQFTGQRLMVRFTFDSVNRFANGGLGWFLDDIVIAGADTQTILVSTTAITPVVDNGVTYYRSFSTPFPLAEGQNVVIVSATQSYSPFLSGQDSVSGFLDTTPPAVSLFGIGATTNNLAQTLSGTVDDETFVSLVITQVDTFGSREIFSLDTLPQNGGFSLPVGLAEGLNTFQAVALDAGNASSTASLVVIGDTTPPSISDDGAIFPVGAVSARAGDEIIFQVTASDGSGSVSGVDKVEFVIDGVVQDRLLGASEVPLIIRDMFAISGNFVLFAAVPLGVPPGQFSVTVRATDLAGNSAETNVSGDVTAALRAQNIFLFDGANLVGINLQAVGTLTFDVEDVLAQSLDMTFLDGTFVGTLVLALGSTTSTAPSADGITVLIQDSTGFATGDRVAIGTGDTSLAQATSAGATTITVDSVSGFSVGQLIVIDGVQDAFGLGFKSGFETSTIASINTTSSAITLTAALTKSHAAGTGATGIEYGRIESVSGNVLTLADALTVATPSGTPVAEKPKLADILQAIFHFTGGLSVGAGSTQGVFQQFIPGVGGDLTILRQGLAYWFLADQTAFAKSAPLPGFTEGPVIPVTMQLDGVFFDATGNPPSLPATITLSKAGWHQIALISEQNRTVERGVRGLIVSGAPQFTFLVEFQKFIQFDSTEAEVEIVGGVFNPLFLGDLANPGDLMQIARGFFVFMQEAGVHGP